MRALLAAAWSALSTGSTASSFTVLPFTAVLRNARMLPAMRSVRSEPSRCMPLFLASCTTLRLTLSGTTAMASPGFRLRVAWSKVCMFDVRASPVRKRGVVATVGLDCVFVRSRLPSCRIPGTNFCRALLRIPPD